MAPKIARTTEIIFVLIVVAVFVVVVNRYYGHDVQQLVQKFQAERRVAAEYQRYEDLAKDIEVPEKTGASERLVPVLVYHGVVSGPSKNEEEFSLDSFTEQLYELKRRGYQTITMAEFQKFVTNDLPIPEKSFVLTFDDGRKDSYYPVDPILKALDYTATMFVITNTLFVEKPSPYYLSTEELKVMVASGRWDLQSHGRDDHSLIPVDAEGNKGRFMSNKKWLESEKRLETDEEYRTRIEQDLVNSKQDLKDVFGIDTIAYALPAGDYGHRATNYPAAEEVIQETVKDIYPMTFFQANPDSRLGYYRENFFAPGVDQYFFRRIKVLSSYSTEELLNILEAGSEQQLPYHEGYQNADRWIRAWGDLTLDPGANMKLRSSAGSNSAAVFLDGSIFWKDYRFTAAVQILSGNRYNLLARVKNGKNFVGCSFEEQTMKLFTVENDDSRVLAIVRIPSLRLADRNNVGIEVKDNTVQCLLNDRTVMKNPIRSGHETGGIGFSVFSSDKETHAALKVGDNAVVPITP